MIRLITVAELENVVHEDASKCITDAEIKELKAAYVENLNDYNLDYAALMNSFGCSFKSNEEAINDAVNQIVISRVLCWIEQNG